MLLRAPPEAIISKLRSGYALVDRNIQEVLVDRRRLLDPPIVVQEFGEQQDIARELINFAKHMRTRHDGADQ